ASLHQSGACRMLTAPRPKMICQLGLQLGSIVIIPALAGWRLRVSAKLPEREAQGGAVPDSSAVGAACPIWHVRHSITMIPSGQHGGTDPSGARWGPAPRASLDDRRENAAE